uniref:RING-type E3 ubiquitin transferase n=1 Tax=Oryza punctata TaxID=4537 RepID=A0A0E0LMN1_ORYPU
MAAAKVVANLQILGLCLLRLCLATSAAAYYPDMLTETSFIPHGYARYADVERRCRSALASSAAELSPFDPVGAGVLARDLSFANGDWGQDAGRAPLMPSHGGDSPFLRLATFAVTHIDTETLRRRRRPAIAAVNVSGVLSFTITSNCCCSSEYSVPHRHVSPEFKLLPGAARLSILFEGVYTETRSSGNDEDIGGGERVLCMVGNGVLPMRGGDSADPWAWARNAGDGSFEPPVMADGNMVLMLRYPKVHTLTTRAVRGELTSTSPTSDNAYFDAVRLVSRIGRYSSYLFRTENGELAATGCSTTLPFVCDDGVEGNCAGDLHLHRGASFCDILTEFSPGDHGVLAVVPNWQCNSNDEFCSRVGPFQTSGGATTTTDRMLTGFAIAMQDLRCEPASDPHGGSKPAARVSAVFRAVSPWEDQQLAVRRTGLGGATLSAEGVWRASTGQLCMTGCLGFGDEACHYRVSLYIPTTFSIRRRSIIVGQITAADGSHFPLSFHQSVPPKHPLNRFGRSSEASLRVAYDYTKVENAGELLQRSEPSGFRSSSIAKALVSYPRQAAAADEMMSLSDLAEDLSLRFQAGPKLPFLPEQKVWPQWPMLHLDMLSVGPLVGSYSPPLRTLPSTPEAQSGIDGGVEKPQLLNVSAVFTLSGKVFGWSPVMSLEGVYNQEDGRMYLIGCRNVEAPWRIVSTSRDLEDGMDCSIEVRVDYPPKTTRWLFSPTATVYISSTRDAGDPLHFNTTELHTTPISYRGGRRDAPPDTLSEQTIEGLVCIAMLSGTIAAAVSQLRYIKSHPDVAPYVSLVALGVQAVGYTATLVTDAKMLPAWPTYNYRMYVGHLHWNMDSTVKALTLASLLLMLRLAQKVRQSRARARARSPVEPGRVPSDGAVLLHSSGVYLAGLVFVLAVHTVATNTSSTSQEVLYDEQKAAAVSHAPPSCMRTRGAVVERYVGLVKEWFLLPQVIGNAVWRVNCKPLRNTYYGGVTAVWLLPHVYRYLRPPVVYIYPEVQDDAMAFYAKATDVVVPVIAVALALSIYVQQRWNYKIVALGLIMPLFAGMEALLARVTLQSDSNTTKPLPPPGSSYMLDYNRPYQAVDRTAKVLAVAAFLLTLCIAWKVRQSRERLLARSPAEAEAARVPSDGKVSHAATVEQHVGLMQDLFLLPQVIGNAAWRVNTKPLAGSFYAGVTAARLLPRVYDLVRPTPVADVFSDEVHEPATANASNREGFFPMAGDVVMPLTAVLLEAAGGSGTAAHKGGPCRFSASSVSPIGRVTAASPPRLPYTIQ